MNYQYGVPISIDEKKRLQQQAARYFDAEMKRQTTSTKPIYSTAYGAMATPAPSAGYPVVGKDMPDRLRSSVPESSHLPPVLVSSPSMIRPTPVPQTDPQRDAFQRGQAIVANLPTLDAQSAVRRAGGSLIDVMPTGVDPGQRVVGQVPRALGLRALPEGSLKGFPPKQVPHYQTDYAVYGKDGLQGTASVIGPHRRAGGGTLSVMEQGNGGTVAGNVAALNSQADALRSLREYRNPGITQGGLAASPQPPSFSPFDRAGDGRGDREIRRNRYESLLDEAANARGFGGRRRRESAMNAAQALLAPGLAEMQQNGQSFQTLASFRPPPSSAMTEYQAAQLGLEREKAGLDKKRFEAEQTRAANQDAFAEHKWAQERTLDVAKQRGPSKDEVMGNLGSQLLSLQMQLSDGRLPEDERLKREKRLNELAALYDRLRGEISP